MRNGRQGDGNPSRRRNIPLQQQRQHKHRNPADVTQDVHQRARPLGQRCSHRGGATVSL